MDGREYRVPNVGRPAAPMPSWQAACACAGLAGWLNRCRAVPANTYQCRASYRIASKSTIQSMIEPGQPRQYSISQPTGPEDPHETNGRPFDSSKTSPGTAFTKIHSIFHQK